MNIDRHVPDIALLDPKQMRRVPVLDRELAMAACPVPDCDIAAAAPHYTGRMSIPKGKGSTRCKTVGRFKRRSR